MAPKKKPTYLRFDPMCRKSGRLRSVERGKGVCEPSKPPILT